jgi:hypothetical protein
MQLRLNSNLAVDSEVNDDSRIRQDRRVTADGPTVTVRVLEIYIL